MERPASEAFAELAFTDSAKPIASASARTRPTAPTLHGRVTKVEDRMTVVERKLETTTTTVAPTTTRTALQPTTTTTTRPDGKVVSMQMAEPRRSEHGETAIAVTVTVDAPIYHDVGVLLRGTTLWRATNPPPETPTTTWPTSRAG